MSFFPQVLWLVNVVVMLLGGAFVSFALIALFVPEYNVGAASLLPQSALWLAVIFGSFLWLVAALGIWGASTHHEGKCLITTYMLVVFVSLFIQLGVGIQVFQKWNELKAGNSAVEQKFVEELQKHPNDWVKTENTLQCCGWYPADHFTEGTGLAYAEANPEAAKVQLEYNMQLSRQRGPQTGANPEGTGAEGEDAKFCDSEAETDLSLGQWTANPERLACRDNIMATMQKYSMALGITGMVIVAIEVVCFFASCCLACCVPKEEGGYSEYFEKIYPVAYYNDHYGGRKKAKGPRSNDGYY